MTDGYPSAVRANQRPVARCVGQLRVEYERRAHNSQEMASLAR